MGVGPSVSRTRWHLTAVVLAASQLVGVGSLTAQTWSGEGRVTGTVLDLDEHPVGGARVDLRLSGIGPPAVATDARGLWSMTGLAAGHWDLEIKAGGFLTARGWVDVTAALTPPVEVMLRPLDEVTPLFSEGSPQTLVRWIEKGNDCLEQGRYAEARGEYEKALPLLPRESRPEVLRAVARAQYLEGDAEAALLSLERALDDAPRDTTTRELLPALLEGLGRGSEAREILARADRGETLVPAEPAAARPATAVAGTGPSVEAPVAHRTGTFRTAFTERSELSGLDVFLRRFGVDAAEVAASDPLEGRYDLADETFWVHVPAAYREGDAWGLLVWISPTPQGGFRRPEMAAALAAHRLIWVGADHSGNQRPRWYRTALALDSVHNLSALYTLDRQRIYVAGYSGGGRVASSLAMLYPEVFRGGLSIYGVDYYRSLPVADKPGASWPAAFARPPREALQAVKSSTRLVLFTGELDFNRAQTKVVHRAMEKDGFQHATYLVAPGASHYTPPAGEWLERALSALDP